ncbi:hypothetical protein, partial [Pseudomonas gingeri]
MPIITLIAVSEACNALNGSSRKSPAHPTGAFSWPTERHALKPEHTVIVPTVPVGMQPVTLRVT